MLGDSTQLLVHETDLIVAVRLIARLLNMVPASPPVSFLIVTMIECQGLRSAQAKG